MRHWSNDNENSALPHKLH